jgi:hypothetical protein
MSFPRSFYDHRRSCAKSAVLFGVMGRNSGEQQLRYRGRRAIR